jgi:hypothetical protein
VNWATFVVEVEHSYGNGRVIDEYWNDLDTRLLLQGALDGLPPELAERIETALGPWDLRFRQATFESNPPMWSGGWWACRIPKNPAPTFREELSGRASPNDG